MSGLREPIRRSLAVAMAILGFGLADSVCAATVVNGSFAVPPNVASQPGGYLEGPNAALSGSGVGWAFLKTVLKPSGGVGGDSGVTAAGGAGFDAPNPPGGGQMGFIQNLGAISQSIDFAPGNYVLSFELAERAYGCSAGVCNSAAPAMAITVEIGEQSFGPFSPASSSSFNTIKVPFQIVANGPQVLQFSGSGSPLVAGQDDHTTFIDAVAVANAPGPVITLGPSDLDPTSTIALKGAGFGSPPGVIKLVFPNPSAEPFSNGSKTEMHFDTKGGDTSAAAAKAIDAGHPQGAVDEQTVDISIASPDGKLTSNLVHAKFHNNAVITSGPKTVTPGQTFLLKGWDFDTTAECQSQNRGKVTVHFPKKAAQKFANQSSDDELTIAVPGAGCLPDAVKITLPADTAGVVEQTVAIAYKSPGGRKSNAWSAKFTPKLELKVLPWQSVTVRCGTQSAFDDCNDPTRTGYCWSNSVSWGIIEGFNDPYTITGQHYGCWGLSSDNATDSYGFTIQNSYDGKPVTRTTEGWMITGFGDFSSLLANASLSTSYNTSENVPCISRNQCFPTTAIGVSVPWHIGASGGAISYTGNIWIQGPTGVAINAAE